MAEFAHIARAAGLRPEYRGCTHYFRGRGHRWRLNCHGQFEMGDKDFDRWANSVAVRIDSAPKTVKEMRAAIATMKATPGARNAE